MFINNGLMQLNWFQVPTTAVHPPILITAPTDITKFELFSEIGNNKCTQFRKFALWKQMLEWNLKTF